jgi:hypothetical protein
MKQSYSRSALMAFDASSSLGASAMVFHVLLMTGLPPGPAPRAQRYASRLPLSAWIWQHDMAPSGHSIRVGLSSPHAAMKWREKDKICVQSASYTSSATLALPIALSILPLCL